MPKRNDLVSADSPVLLGRVPYKLRIGAEGQLLFRWLFIGEKSFTEPFFGETLSRCLSLSQNSTSPLPETTAETVVDFAARTDALEPSGLLFHVSRCGSTLLSQLLALNSCCIVLSEVPLLDDVLRLPLKHPSIDEKRSGELFRAVMRVLGQKRSSQETHVFVKLDSWHTLLFGRIRAQYPQTPAFLLYRSPAEVLRSQERLRGMHAVPGLIEPELFGFSRDKVTGMTAGSYLERVLERYFEAYLELRASDKHAQPISYHDGPLEMLRQIAERTDIRFDETTIAAITERVRSHAKFPGQPFVAESDLPDHDGKASELFHQLNVGNRRFQALHASSACSPDGFIKRVVRI